MREAAGTVRAGPDSEALRGGPYGVFQRTRPARIASDPGTMSPSVARATMRGRASALALAAAYQMRCPLSASVVTNAMPPSGPSARISSYSWSRGIRTSRYRPSQVHPRQQLDLRGDDEVRVE